MANITHQATIKIIKILVLFMLIVIPYNASAAEIAGVWFNENYLDQGINMSLQGTGLKSIFFFKAFAAGFYKGPGHDSDPLSNYPKRIEVEYFVNIPGEKLNSYTLERMKDNVSKNDLKAIDREIQLMGNYFVNLKPGDRFSLTYIPSVGTKFEHNGKLVGIIKGNAFAKALFSVWIGKKPFDNQLKNQVLGLSRV